MSDHTPTPWMQDPRLPRMLVGVRRDTGRLNPVACCAVLASSECDTHPEDEANTEFVLDAVNTHAALATEVARLREQVRVLVSEMKLLVGLAEVGPGPRDWERALEHARETVRAAEGVRHE